MKSLVTFRFGLLTLLGTAAVAAACLAVFQRIEYERSLDPESTVADFGGETRRKIEWVSTEAPDAMPESGVTVIPKHSFSSNFGFVRDITVDQRLGTVTVKNHRGSEAFELRCSIGGFASDGLNDHYLQVFAEGGGIDDGSALVTWNFEEPSKTLTIDIYISFRHHSLTEHTELRLYWNGSSFMIHDFLSSGTESG